MTAPPLRVALAQVRCAWADRTGNLERMAGWAERARDGGAQLVVFPELCVPGTCKDERLASVTETLDGPSVAAVRALARRLGLAIGFGVSEKTEGKPYNAYVVVEPDGRLAGVYRKNHIPVLEAPFWQGHPEHSAFDALGRRFAVALCWDNKYLELAYRRRTGRMRWKTHDQMRDDFYAYIPGLARENRFWALFVNQSGRPHECLDFVGPSFVVDPTGRLIAETRDGGEQLVFANVAVAAGGE
jgi:predicted amidohydrolase